MVTLLQIERADRIKAEAIVGGLSQTSKMPCKSFSTSAFRCTQGSKLRMLANSTCSHCYALKGRSRFKNVQGAYERRWKKKDDPRWTQSMITLLQNETHFRWFDSGDIADLAMLKRIVAIAEALPNTQFWLPTKEVTMVRQFLKNGVIPSNLTIRISATLIDGLTPTTIEGCQGSIVVRSGDIATKAQATLCKAPMQENQCRECRACWNKNIPIIAYTLH